MMSREVKPADPDTIERGKEYKLIFVEDELGLYRVDGPNGIKNILKRLRPIQGKVVKVEHVYHNSYFQDTTKSKYVIKINKIPNVIPCDFLYELDSRL